MEKPAKPERTAAPSPRRHDGRVVSLAGAQWRLGRIARLESGLFTGRLEDLRAALPQPDAPE